MFLTRSYGRSRCQARRSIKAGRPSREISRAGVGASHFARLADKVARESMQRYCGTVHIAKESRTAAG